MQDKSFTRVMNQIAGEEEVIRQGEEAARRRREFYLKVRGWIAFSLWTAFLGSVFYYHAELQQFVSEKFLTAKPTVSAGTSERLKSIQVNAAKRDQVLETVTSSK